MKDGDNFLLTKDGIIRTDFEIPEPEPLKEYMMSRIPNFPHMMLKEIHDQPTSLSNALSGQ